MLCREKSQFCRNVPPSRPRSSLGLQLLAKRPGEIGRIGETMPTLLPLGEHRSLRRPSFARSQEIGSNSFPEARLLIEPIEFEAAEIKPRDDPYDFAIINNRYVAVAAVFHTPQYLDRHRTRRHRFRITRHDVGQFRTGGAFSLRKDAVNGVAPGKDAYEAPVAFGHQNGANTAVAHPPAGLSDRRV